ncbi:polysaccharide biosynthesis C-terminal domain-containing protein, partial [Escherichia coli]|uniref:polysaccharide biosynthesis C-terminal domain-containing protein n=1 Tax=Escherichia coli TaxID=562 RepID=UPI00200E7935
NVALNDIFIPRFGIIAAAYITLFTYLLSTSLIYFISNRYHKIYIEWGRFLGPLALITVIHLVISYTDFFETNHLIKGTILFVFLLVAFYFLWISNSERAALKKIIK